MFTLGKAGVAPGPGPLGSVALGISALERNERSAFVSEASLRSSPLTMGFLLHSTSSANRVKQPVAGGLVCVINLQ